MHGPCTERLVAGHRVLHLPEASSTSDVARAGLLDGSLRPGDVVLADVQTAGRGRRGRAWVTVPGRSLAASVLLPAPRPLRPAAFTVRCAVAACRALESCGARELRIKWPNDLVREDRKIGGLLAEALDGPDGAVVVLGLGVNLRLRAGDLPGELAGRAGDAGLPEGTSRESVLAAWLRELDAALRDADAGDAERSEEYRRRSWLTGRRLELRVAGRSVAGVLADVSPDGDLVLADGRVLPGETTELVSVAR